MRYFLLLFVLTIAVLVGILGFQGSHSRRTQMELFPDMARQNKVRPQTPSEFFANRESSRLIPAGTVAHTKAMDIGGKEIYAYEDSPVNTGRIPGTTNFVATNPLPLTKELWARGQQRFMINCMPCHGPDGDGKGITSKYNMFSMANFHDKRLIDMPDGQIFNTITYGKNLMGSYGANVVPLDRWAIIYYVRTLELTQLATVNDVPPDQRGQFQK